MGQSLSLNHPPPTRLASQNTLRQSLKRVHSERSEETEDGKRGVSLSLPASPSIRRRTVSVDPQNGDLPESPSKAPLSFESMLKNLEEFAQHQWPTWAKRRGWIADMPPDSASSATVTTTGTDDGSGRVVQVDKDKWVFLRHRKKCTPSISPVSAASIPVETVIEEDGLLDGSAVEKMAHILQIDENRIATAIGGGQRSRRSSGYASASSSPSAIKRVTEPSSNAVVTTGGHLAVPEDTNEDWKISSLYEVTLRWMFDADSSDQSFIEEDKIVINNNSVLDDSGTCSLGETHPTTEDLINPDTESTPLETIRIYLHFFCRQKNKLPSFIDFRPTPLTDDANADNPNVSSRRQMYTLVFQDGSPAPEALFPREIACIELVQQIVQSHPLLDWEPRKLAIYEKSWQPGKTSRARLRRLNDFDCPLLLAQHWQASDTNPDALPSSCAKTLILQESQNGDIPVIQSALAYYRFTPFNDTNGKLLMKLTYCLLFTLQWEEFTVAELSSFLKVLDREEKNHEMQIRERYQLLNERLRETMQFSNPSARNIVNNQTNHLAVLN